MPTEQAIKNVTAERLVLGILLNHPDWLLELNGLIRTDYFYLTGNKLIFHIVTALMQEGAEVIDSMAILARAEKIARATDVLADNGGIVYLEEIKELAEEHTLEDLRTYAKDVTSCSYKRDLIKLQEEIAEKVKNEPDKEISDLDGLYQEKLQVLMNKYSSTSAIATIGERFDDIWSEIEEARQGDGLSGLPSKFPMVNKYFTYENGELIIIGGRAKAGKSVFGMNEAYHKAVVHGIPVAIFDTEMKTKTFMLRILALDSCVPINEIKTGVYEDDIDKVLRVEESKERIKKAPLFHFYDPFWDKSKVSHMAKLLKLRYNIGLLIYDYIKVAEVGKDVKEHNELGNWTIFLKNLAGELDLPILTFGQMSPYEKRLADSDKLNRYCSTVAYFIQKDQEQMKRDFGFEEGGNMYLWVDYNRNGNSMEEDDKGINLTFFKNISRIEQSAYQILDDDYND